MKKISVVIPCYNEETNVKDICGAVEKTITENLNQYDYEIILIDNKSKDNTRTIIRELCRNNRKVKAIFNIKNFGQFNSPYHALCQSSGDCSIMISADFQDPVELIPEMVAAWENGANVVCPVKTSDQELKIVYFLRSIYYKIIKKMSNVEQIEHFTGFGLYDKSFVDILRNLKDPTPFLRGIVAEYATNIHRIEYEHKKRKSGKSSNNFLTLYDAAILSFTSYTKGGLRLATFVGGFISLFSIFVSLFYFIYKLVMWDSFATGNAPILMGVFFLGGVQLFFIGLLGEYIMSMNARVINRPLVIEEERINF